ncbi:TPA_asm: P6 [Durio betacytorhabdovirus 1]|nr:TPA_asm: P6 [Durio betacytorhabdovirus 1]
MFENLRDYFYPSQNHYFLYGAKIIGYGVASIAMILMKLILIKKIRRRCIRRGQVVKWRVHLI